MKFVGKRMEFDRDGDGWRLGDAFKTKQLHASLLIMKAQIRVLRG